MRIVPVVMGTHTHYMVVDAEGFPRAQGTLALCERALSELQKALYSAPEPVYAGFLREENPA